MQIDFTMPPGPLGTVPELARRAVRLGFDGILTAETSHDPFLPVVAAAQAAPGLDIGTAIAVAFPRSPMVTAQVAWDLAELTGGRFLLGLGTQVKAHIERRFSTTWGSPGPRLREYILALRAIWDTWQHGVPLRFQGDFYSFTLMTPFFSPGPIPHPDLPVYIAGVGPHLCRLAGELCQGIHIHPFHTIRYLDEVVLPRLAEGAVAAGRSPDEVVRAAPVFAVTGRSEEEMASTAQVVKAQIAFYASTPTYRGVLDLHGWDFGDRLSAMARRGEWKEMPDLISDEVLAEVAVVAPLDELGPAVKARYGPRIQRMGYYGIGPGLEGLSDDEWAALVAATR